MRRLDRLKKQFAASLESARRDPMHGLPAWADGEYLARAHEIPVVICGTGIWATTFLSAAQGQVEVIAHVNDSEAGNVINGRPCLSTVELIDLAKKRPELVYLNLTKSHEGIGHFECLSEELGLKMLNYLQALRAFRIQTDIRVADWLPAIANRGEEYMAIEPLLHDELSAEALYSVLLYHLDTDRDIIVAGNSPGDSTYFRTGLFDLTDHEVFVDVGAYDGDSVRNFIHATRSRFDRVHAFEPDPVNFVKMQEWHEQQRRFEFAKRVVLHQQAVGEACGTVMFNGTGDEGACVQSVGAKDERMIGFKGGTAVECIRLDDAISDRISLLKLDVEGHELAVLRGAVNHIKGSHPRIASCAYHLPTDLIDLPQFFHRLDSGYSIALRHHSHSRYDTVLYAF